MPALMRYCRAAYLPVFGRCREFVLVAPRFSAAYAKVPNSEETIAKLQKAGIRIEVGDKSAYRTDKRPVRMEYLDDTDLPEFSQLPTFKRICICILKNDHACKYMGFSPNKSETQRRRKIMEKYESLLRTSDREELPEPCL